MANATGNIQLDGIGQGGKRIHLPVKTGATIYEGTMVAQQIADGLLVAATSAGTWPAIGKATMTVTAATAGQRLWIETNREYILAQGSGGDAFSEASQLGSIAYAFDDHTVYDNDAAGTLQPCGTFEGMEPDGRVRLKMSTAFASAAGAADVIPQNIQYGSGTLAAGVLAVTGVTLTASSVIICNRKTAGGTSGDEIRVPTADRTAGALGTGSFTARAFLSAVAATSDTSTFDWLIVG